MTRLARGTDRRRALHAPVHATAVVRGARAVGAGRTVLVIDDHAEDVAGALRNRAMTPVAPRTPLEVIDLLVADRRVELCVVGARFGGHAGDDIARFLADQFPWVRILTLGDDVARLAEEAEAAGDDTGAAGW